MTLAELIQAHSTDSQASFSALKEYQEAKAYYHGHQLSELERAKLEARGQVPIYENIYKMICDKILGYKLQSMQEIRVSGKQEQDKPVAEVINDLLKVFNSQKEYEKEIYKRDFELLMGQSVVELWVEQDRAGNKHITLKTLPNESFLIDAYSVDKFALDSTRFHKKQNISYTEAKILLGEGVDIFIGSNDIADQRVFIIESWVKEYEESTPEKYSWNRYLWHPQGGIYKKEIRPFKNNAHPFVIAKYQIDEKSNFYGIFRDIKPIQDYINFAEMKMGNMLATTKALYELDAVDDIADFTENITKDNAVVGVRSGALKENKIQFIQHHADINALSQKTEQKRQMAKILSGLNDEALALASNRQSGVAIAQRRETGLLGLQYFVNTADNAERLLYEKVIDLITHYFTKKQVFRISEKKKADRYFSINTTPENTLKIGAFDLEFKTQLKQQGREERFAHWSEILKTLANIRPDIVDKVLPVMLKDVDSQIVPDIEEIIELADQQAQEATQANTPIAELEQQIHIETLKAQLAEIQAKANKYNAQASVQEASAQTIAAELATQARQQLAGAAHAGKQTASATESKAQKRANKLMQFNPKKLASDEAR